MPPKILVITGPTASGKPGWRRSWPSAITARWCPPIPCRYTAAWTSAPPNPRRRKCGVPHHMIDVADPEEDFSAARYVDMAAACVDDVLSCGKLPVLAGGTGLYIDSLLSGRTFAAFDGASPLRSELEARYAREGGEALLRELARADPDAAARLHPNDAKRIVRALEVWLSTGRTITAHNERTRAVPPRYDALTLTLDYERREDMWARIDRRVDKMMRAGLVEEVRALLDSGCPGGAPPCRPSATRR